MPPSDSPVSRLRLGLVLWAAGMLGVLAITFDLPGIVASVLGEPPEIPLWVYGVNILQTGGLVGAAAALGARLAPGLGLRAPLAEAVAGKQPLGPALRPLLVPGVVGGLVGGLVLVGAGAFAPAEVQALAFDPSLASRLLYGGITEEVLVRWGFMTGLVWLGWRLAPSKGDRPGALVMGGAIVLSSLLFGVGHLPIAAQLVGGLTSAIVAYIVIANALFGLIAGWLYWKRGLGAAIIAHMLAHVVMLSAAALTG